MNIPVKYSMGKNANFIFRIFAKLHVFLYNKINNNWQKYPVIINNYNRLDFLMRQINWLEKAGIKNIYIIDNSSTYPPLLEYYKKSKYTIFRLDSNVGHLALWKSHIFKWFENTYYVYTDPDILPTDNCPLNSVKYFKELLDKYTKVGKVGFGLKIDDIPSYYSLKNKVIDWESKYWENEIENNIYDAKIDTTFALYRPNLKGGHKLPAIRTGGLFIAQHLTWYIDFNNLSEEEKYYIESCNQSSSWYKRQEIYE